MPDHDLNAAIQLIQQGQPDQAQPILQALIQANPQDLAAWSWYARSCQTPEKRLKALELCLRFNPGNPQVTEAIHKLQAKLSGQPPVPAPESTPAPSQQPFNSYSPEYESVYSQDSPAPSQQPFSSYSPEYESAYSQETPAISAPLVEAAANMSTAPEELQGLLLPEEPVSRPFAWYEVWFKALTQANAPSYFELLRDPTAGPGRAYLWILMTSLVTSLASFLFLFANIDSLKTTKGFEALQEVSADPNKFYIIGLIAILLWSISSVFGLVLSGAFFNLLAKLFGGIGNYSRTVYLIGAYAAPLAILSSLISLIPLVGSCVSIPLSFYGIWMQVCAIQAAHRMNTGRAFIVILLPTLVLCLLICIVSFGAWQSISEMIRSQPGGY